MHVVVDTNVPIVANQRISPQASVECITTCIKTIKQIQSNHILVLDDGWRILKEYMQKLHSSGQPGVGDAFLKWVLTNHTNPKHCEKIRITLRDNQKNDFEQFPTDPDLANFDWSDRKFVAVALTHPKEPPIFNATDTDWYDYQNALNKHNIKINFLCPDAMQKTINH